MSDLGDPGVDSDAEEEQPPQPNPVPQEEPPSYPTIKSKLETEEKAEDSVEISHVDPPI